MLLSPASFRVRVVVIWTLILAVIGGPIIEGAERTTRRRQEQPARTPAQPTPAAQPAGQPAGPSTVVLENGLTVVLVPIANCTRVAVESIYRVGFLHEPVGMPQISHLVEHLVVNGKIPGYAEGEANKALNAAGMANAETLPHFTHYDYVSSSGNLEMILKIEAARMQSLEFTPELIRREALRCYEEVDFVAKNPETGMLKYGFIALNQAWRNQSKAAVRSGLDAMDEEAVKEFHRAHYVPNRMILVLAGGIDNAQALQLVKNHFERIPRGTGVSSSIDWVSAPSETLLQWDANIRVFCLAYVPPVDPKDRLLGTLFGNSMLPKLQNNPTLKLAANFLYTPNTTWPLDPLPFFVYAAPKTNLSLLKMQQMIVEGLETPGSKRPNGPDMQQFKITLAEVIARPTFTMELITQHATKLGQQLNQDTSKAVDTVIGNIALQAGMRELLLEGLTNREINEIARMTAEELEWAFNRITEGSRQRLAVIVPQAKASSAAKP